MKYGIYIAYWEHNWEMKPGNYVEKIKRLGFDDLEFCPASFKTMSKAEMIDFRDAAYANGLTLSTCYGSSAEEDFAQEDPASRKHAVECYRKLIENHALMGIQHFSGPLYSQWPTDFSRPFDKQRSWAWSVECMREVGKIAEDNNVTLSMEVLNRFEGYLLNTAEEAIRYVDEVNSPSVKILLDTYHMNIEEDSYTDAILSVGSRLGHFHVGENNRRVPGKGRMPWSEIGSAVHRIGYDQLVVMEPFVMSGENIGRDIHVWHDLSESSKLDCDAAAAVAFLHHVFRD